MLNTWDKIKKAQGIITASVAIAGTVISSAVWITGYFATKNYVKYVKCISESADDSLAAQLASSKYYDEYKKYKNNVIELEGKLSNDKNNLFIKAELDEIEKRRDSIWQKSEIQIKIAEESNRRNRKCSDEAQT